MRGAVSFGMLALGLALGVSAFAMPRASAGGDAVRKGGTFRISLALRNFDSVDPALAYFPPTWGLLEATCAKLVNYPDKDAPAGLRAVAEVAADTPTVSPDGRIYRFRIRPGFRFSDNTKLTARSFERAIERLADPAMRSPAAFEADYVQDFVGADLVLAGKATKLSGVEARGNKLVITLKRRVPDFLARLAMPFFCAVPPDLPADPEGAREYASAGPYYVAKHLPGRRVTLRQNPHYRGKRPRRVNSFVVTFTSNGTEVIDRIEAGRADWGWISSPAWAARGDELMRKYGRSRLSRLQRRPSSDLSFFILNTRRGIFRDAHLRRAVNFAVNRRRLVKLHGAGLASVTDQYIPPAMPGFRDVRLYQSTPRVARALKLARGRLGNGKVVLYTGTPELRFAEAQVVKSNLAQIGLQVEIRQFADLTKRILTPNEPYDMAWSGWTADYPDPYGILNILLGDRPYFKSPTYTRRLQRASRLGGTKRYREYARLDAELADKVAPLLVYMTRNEPTLVSRNVDPRCRVLRPALDLAAVCLKR